MMSITAVLQIIVAIGLLNVWLLRYGRDTSYRGGNAKNLKDEFAAYGSWNDCKNRIVNFNADSESKKHEQSKSKRRAKGSK